MSKCSYLRPLVTPNFVFDFPSKFKTKYLSNFINGGYNQIVQAANQDMQAIMSGKELIWYLQSKTNQKIVGWVKFTFENPEQTEATLDSLLLNQLSDEDKLEISQRITHICTTNLQLQKITIGNNLDEITCQQLKNHYNVNNNKLIMR